MAYLPPSHKKSEQDDARLGVDRPASGLGPTSPGSAPASATSAQPPQQSGSGFQGIQAYLSANRGGAMQQGIQGRQDAAQQAARSVATDDTLWRDYARGNSMFTPTSQDDVNSYWSQHLAATRGARDSALRQMDQTTDVSNRWDRAVVGQSAPPRWESLRATVSNPTAPVYNGAPPAVVPGFTPYPVSLPATSPEVAPPPAGQAPAQSAPVDDPTNPKRRPVQDRR